MECVCEIELERMGLSFTRAQKHDIFYEEIFVGRRADFVVEDWVIVALKAFINIENVHLAQAKNYAVAYDHLSVYWLISVQEAYSLEIL